MHESDVRAEVVAEREATIAAHQPGERGRCMSCPDVMYPCTVLLYAEEAVDRLSRRSTNSGADFGADEPKERTDVR